jgi:uncharacterized protein YcbK (DUF882 family)
VAGRSVREKWLLSLLSRHAHKHVDQVLAAVPGLVVTSTYRTPAHNARVGGVPGSLHTRRRAADLAGTYAEQHAAVRLARSLGAVESLNEGDHAHVAW